MNNSPNFPPGRPILLIVDDERLLREAIAFDFRRTDFDVLTAGSGLEAISILQDTRVDAIVSDLRMPNVTGLELLDYVARNIRPAPPVIIVTAIADSALAEAVARGAEAVFPKPFNRAALLETVAEAARMHGLGFARKSARAPASMNASLSFPSAESRRGGMVLNLGRGGFFVSTGSPLPSVGEKIEFELNPEIDDKIDVRGIGLVRWVQNSQEKTPAGFGVEFLEIDDKSRKNLIALVNALKTRAYIPMN